MTNPIANGVRRGKSHWMEKAFANSHGQYKARAARAGRSTGAQAAKDTASGSTASTHVKRQANLVKIASRY